MGKPNLDEAALKARYRDAARRVHTEPGVLEIDDNADVSLGDDTGAYVSAWVWVSDDDL